MISTLNKDPCRPPLQTSFINTKHALINKLNGKNLKINREDIIKRGEKLAKKGPLKEPLPDAFDILINSINETNTLSHIGHEKLFGKLSHSVKNRILINDYVEKHPEVRDQEIEKPIFILGFPRTGTTLLYNLLSQYPTARSIHFWELQNLIPPPNPNDIETKNRKIEKINQNLEGMYKVMPKLRQIHEIKAENPEECLRLFENSFSCASFNLYGFFDRYFNWLMTDGIQAPYDYYKLQLQILQSTSNGAPWVLKSPAHMYHLNTLLKTFPDARIVHTHRDVKEVISSCCSLRATFMRVNCNETDYAKVGQFQLQAVKNQLEKSLSARKNQHQKQFYDVNYHDLVKSPQKTVTDILEHFELPVENAHLDSISNWVTENRQHKHGKHKHKLADFKLSDGIIEREFKEYNNRFLKR